MGYSRLLPFLLSLGALASGCSSARADSPADSVRDELTKLRGDFARLRDDDAIRQLGYCYARGLDEISIHYADRPKGLAVATALYATCFDPNVEISVFPVGAKTPFKVTRNIKEWVEFADGFYAGVPYTSTRHLVSNFFIERTGETTARMVSYAVGPHFVKGTAKDAASAGPSLEYYSLRYLDELARQGDGSWRVVKKSVYFDEVWRGVGFFPNGNPDGR